MLYTLLIAALVAVDQLTKYLVRANIPQGGSVPFLPGFLDFTYVKNTGMAFSMLSQHTWLLTVLSAVVSVGLIVLLVRGYFTHPIGKATLSRLLAGAIGNLIDRARVGYVVDMFHFEFWPSYPVFNVADICVVAGAILGAIYYMWLYEKYDQKKPAPEIPPEETDDGTCDAPTE